MDTRKFAQLLLRWYDQNRRELPWRVSRGYPDPYHVLLSELMLQQTQVATVIPYFHRFLAEFPTISRLAATDEQQVLRLWQGLGYYSRARNLHRAAQQIVEHYSGRVPDSVEQLLELPGIGRYTAGAIASLAYGVKAPILDGNVQRVLCRLDALASDPREPAANAALWKRAQEILPEERIAEFNSAMMELGAVICTPRTPRCDECPVRPCCVAAEKGVSDQIPPPRIAMRRPLEKRDVFCIEHRGHWLIEQRPATGRWAGMWQFLTVPRSSRTPDLQSISDHAQARLKGVRKLGLVRHDLTHRRYEFTAWHCTAESRPDPRPGRAWTTLKTLDNYPMSRPQLRIAAMLAPATASVRSRRATP